MELSQSEKDTARHQYDCFCKKILREESRSIKKSMAMFAEKDAFLASILQERALPMYHIDKYPSEMFRFEALTYQVEITNEALAQALQSLSAEKLAIILLAYFFDMPDREIAEALHMTRGTVQRKRTKTLKYLKERVKMTDNE